MSRRFTLEQKAEIIGRYMEQKEKDPKLVVEDYLAQADICNTMFHRWKRNPKVLSTVNGGNVFVTVPLTDEAITIGSLVDVCFPLFNVP